MRMIGSLMLGLLLSLSASAKDFQAGKEYVVLSKPQPVNSSDKIEVIEFFWYACPHCYQLEPILNSWVKDQPADVEFIRIPAVLGPHWELLARGYYTADVLGVADKIHAPLFDYLHKSRKRIRNVGDLKTFFVSQGVSEADFEKTFNSFAVVTKTNRAKQASQRYGLDSVPTLIVAGKYRTGPSIAGGNKGMFEVVNHLIGLERPSQTAEPAAAAAQ